MSVWVSVGEWYAIVCLPPLASFPRACLPCPPTASDNPASLSDASRGLQEHHLSLSHEWLYLQGYRAFSETRKANLYNCLFLFMDKHEKKPGGIWAAQAWMSINNIMLAFFDRIWVSHTRLQLISVEHSKVDLLIKYWNSLLNKLDEIKQYGEERFGAVWNTESPTRPNWVTVNNAVDRSSVGSAGWITKALCYFHNHQTTVGPLGSLDSEGVLFVRDHFYQWSGFMCRMLTSTVYFKKIWSWVQLSVILPVWSQSSPWCGSERKRRKFWISGYCCRWWNYYYYFLSQILWRFIFFLF